jgi:hypothetical protein
MASIVQLKRSALSGKVPDTGSLNLGELAVNTYDGKIYFKKSGSIESVESVVTTNSVVTGSIRLEGTGSFGSLQVNDTLTVNHGVSVISGSLGITSDLTVLGQINARQFNIAIISSSTLFESGSSNFGNSLDDTHTFTGSVNITGSFLLNGQEVGGGTTTGSFTGSFTGDGSGLRGVVSDDLPIDGWDYESNSSASISEFNNESKKYIIDFQWEQEVGTPIGFKTFISNVTGSSQIVPTEEGIKFIVANQQVALVGPNGIESVPPAGTVSGSSQLTSSYDERYVLSGSITQTTWDNIASKPTGIISGSSQLTASVLATTGSNTFVGTQTLSGSIIPAIDNTYDLGSATYQWRDIYVSSGSLYIDGTKVLGSTGNELQITTDEGQSIKILEAGSDSIILQSADGDIQLKTSGGGNLLFDPTTGLIDVRGTFQIQDGYKVTSSGGNGIVFGNNVVVSGSLESTGNVTGANISNLQSTFNTFTGSSNTSLNVLNTYTASNEINISNLHSYTSSVKNAINVIGQGTSSVTTIYGNLVVEGTTITVSASNLAVADNMIYLNDGNEITDPDLGIAGNYNDGTYHHTGIFSDASDSHTWKVYKGYTPEPSQSIDTTHGSFTLADFQAGTLKGAIAATNGVVSGSSQIDATSTTNWSTGIKTQLNSNTVISGSSQIDVMSTTNIARLATTGSNTFTGTISINSGTTGFLTLGASGSYGSISSGGGGGTIYLNGSTRGGSTTAASNTVVVATDGEFYITNGLSNSTKFLVASNGNTTISGTFTENSSIRYKENVETIKYGLDKVLQMRGVTYDKKNTGVREVGVIAEEVYDVLPEVVLKNEEGEIDSVSYGRIVGVLIEAIKDLKKEIEDLKSNR